MELSVMIQELTPYDNNLMINFSKTSRDLLGCLTELRHDIRKLTEEYGPKMETETN